jgi:hypothetical protein
VLQDDHVPRLLAAEHGSGHLHPLEDVLVTDRGADDLAAGRLDRALQSAVRQDRHDQAARQGIAFEPLESEDPEDLVAVHDAALPIDRDQPIGVAVERETDVRPSLCDRPGERTRRRRARLDVDVDPVRVHVDGFYAGAGRGQDLLTRRTAGAVRAVEDDVQPTGVDRGGQATPVLEVALDGVGRVDAAAERGIAGAAELAFAPDEGLELVLDRVVELETVGVEHFQPVIVGRIVRGRHHDPRAVVAGLGQVGERRGGDDADDMDVDTEAGRPGHDRRDEHVARAPRVLPDDDRGTGLGESLGRRTTERVGHGRL